MKLRTHISKIISAIILMIGVGYLVYPYLIDAILQYKELAGIISGVFVFGLIFDIVRLGDVNAKWNWVIDYKIKNKVTASSVRKTPKVFAELSKKFNINGKETLTQEEYYNASKSLETAFNNNKDAGKFFVKLCFMAGFLAAFLCIILAISSISDVFVSLNLDAGDSIGTLSELQSNLANPLKAMNASFALSFLGIYLSCVLSYIDRQVFVAENKLLIYIENWLLSCTKQKTK